MKKAKNESKKKSKDEFVDQVTKQKEDWCPSFVHYVFIFYLVRVNAVKSLERLIYDVKA